MCTGPSCAAQCTDACHKVFAGKTQMWSGAAIKTGGGSYNLDRIYNLFGERAFAVIPICNPFDNFLDKEGTYVPVTLRYACIADQFVQYCSFCTALSNLPAPAP
eukprot:gene12288-biopygen1496